VNDWKVTKLRYDQAQAIFDRWRRQAVEENAKSVQPEFDAIMKDVALGVMKEEEGARKIADRFASIRDLLLPQDVDSIRALVGPHLQNHAVRNLETGDVDRAVDNLNRALNKIGARSAQQEADLKQFKARYEQWAKKWRETKEQKFPEIDLLMRKNRVQRAKSEIDTLEYRMLKDPTRPLPPAIKDPAFLGLKERLASLQKRYEESMQEMWDKVKALGAEHEHRPAIPILQKALEEWEHPPYAKDALLRHLEYHQAEVKRAEDKRALGRHYEKNGELAHAIRQYEESLQIQKDSALEQDLARLKATVQKRAQAKALWSKAQQLQQGQSYEEALKKYKEGLALWDDSGIKNRVAGLEKFLADREKQKTAKSSASKAKVPSLPQSSGTQSAASPPASVSGKWRTSEGELTLTQNGRAISGSYPQDRGEIIAEMDGNVLEGYWIEDAANKRCATAKKGRFYWGRIKWIFTGDRFSGSWGYCEEAPVRPWTGERLGAVSDAGKSGGASNGSPPPTASPKAKTTPPQPAPTTAAAPEASVPKGWKSVVIGNVRFAVPASWQYTTEPDPESGKIHIYWDGSFDTPKHGVSGGVVGSYDRAKSEFSGLRVVHLAGVDVLRADDGSAVNFLFPPMPDGRAVLLVVFRGPSGRQEVIDAVLDTVRVDGQGGSEAAGDAPPERTFEIGNIYAVDNGPTQPTVFSLKGPRILAAITNYHWNNGKGAVPGTIALRDATGRLYGPWKAEGGPGQGGVPNAYWIARPRVELPAGTYTVVDSDPATWAHNPQSGGRGFTRVETLPVDNSASGPVPKAAAMERWVNARNPNHYVLREMTPQGARWVEYSDGKARFRFEEKGRSPSEGTVTLYDASRKISATLYPDHFDYGRGGKIIGTHRGGWE
jgi:tetratricopeptide (TPR) repeat protein